MLFHNDIREYIFDFNYLGNIDSPREKFAPFKEISVKKKFF